MIRLEQIQLLEKKIDKAVEYISILKKENQTLKNGIQKSQTRMTELENLLEQFKGEQNKIEEGLMNALTKLDSLEDDVSGVSTHPTADVKEERPVIEEIPEPEIEETPAADESAPVDDEAEEKEIELDIF